MRPSRSRPVVICIGPCSEQLAIKQVKLLSGVDCRVISSSERLNTAGFSIEMMPSMIFSGTLTFCAASEINDCNEVILVRLDGALVDEVVGDREGVGVVKVPGGEPDEEDRAGDVVCGRLGTSILKSRANKSRKVCVSLSVWGTTAVGAMVGAVNRDNSRFF